MKQLEKIAYLDDKGKPAELDVEPLVLIENLKKYEDKEIELAKNKANPSAYVQARSDWVAEVLSKSGVSGELRMTAAQVNKNWYTFYWGGIKAVPGAPFD